MKRISIIMLLLVSVFAFNSCDEEFGGTQDLNYVTFEAPSINVGVETGGSTQAGIKVYATQITGADRTFNVKVGASTTADAGAYVVPATVTIPANTNEGEFVMTIKDFNLGLAGKKLVLDIEAADGLYKGPATTVNITCSAPVVFDFTFDGYASECSWELLDGSGTAIVTSPEYEDGDKKAQALLCLEQGTYTFNVYDVYGDGLTYPNTGGITITKGGTVLGEIDGDFGSEATVTFVIE